MSFNEQFDQHAAWRREFALRLKLLAQWMKEHGLLNAAVEDRMLRLQAQVRSDPVLLKRLLGNLLSNAIRHTERGGIMLAVRRGAAGPRIEVWDTGVGISAEHQQAIFQEFYRVTQHNGTEQSFGLGLAIVLRLAAALKHQLSMRSRPGRGTVFQLAFELPAQTDPKAGPEYGPDDWLASGF